MELRADPRFGLFLIVYAHTEYARPIHRPFIVLPLPLLGVFLSLLIGYLDHFEELLLFTLIRPLVTWDGGLEGVSYTGGLGLNWLHEIGPDFLLVLVRVVTLVKLI